MDLYRYDLSLYDYGSSDPAMFESMYRYPSMVSSSFHRIYDDDDYDRGYGRPPRPRPQQRTAASPPKRRHDGTSPLPLGMDWSLPPPVWEGRYSIWPQDRHNGWSYCVSVPSWTIQPPGSGSNSVVFYKVQVGVQSPEGVTTTQELLRRFNDFLNLFSELKKAFPKKNLPPAPPRKLLKVRSRTLLEERRSALENWIEKLLSDIEVSRTVPVAAFLELEAVARSSFYDSYESGTHSLSSGATLLVAEMPSVASNVSIESINATFQLATPDVRGHCSSEYSTESFEETDLARPGEETKDRVDPSSMLENCELVSHARRLSNEGMGTAVSSLREWEKLNLGVKNSLEKNNVELPETSDAPRTTDTFSGLGFEISNDILVALPSEVRHELDRVLVNMQERLATAKTDMEDLIARLDQETAMGQHLTKKVQDLELELGNSKESSKENLHQTLISEREQFNQVQWDMAELKKLCMELELKLKSEQDSRVHMESTRVSMIQENAMLLKELNDAKKQMDNLAKERGDLELKSKSDVKHLDEPPK